MLKSSVCSYQQLDSPLFRQWAPRLRERHKFHRKLWEFCYITQALHERGLLRTGCTGLGFGVGKEPLTSFFASCGCEVVATDLDPAAAALKGWAETDQHVTEFGNLNDRGLCTAEELHRLVSLRYVDMNQIPADLTGFDFTWSSCVLEHLGSIRKGKEFIYNQMHCLKEGGVAVHTTELNLSSESTTIDENEFLVLFRKSDFREIARTLTAEGHSISLDLRLGRTVADNYVDLPPYRQSPHLRLLWDEYITTSIGLIIRKGRANPLRRTVARARLSVGGRLRKHGLNLTRRQPVDALTHEREIPA
jgi:hypothetical protein